MPLTPRQRRFALEYRVDGNATQAAIRAGYSARSAYSTASDLLKKPEVQALLAEHQEKVLAKMAAEDAVVEAAGDAVLEELAHLAHSDLLDAFNDDGTLKHPRDMPVGIRKSIKSIEFTELFEGASGERFVVGRTVKLSLWPKDRGLELLGKNRKLFTDRVEVAPDESLLDLLTEARKPEGGE